MNDERAFRKKATRMQFQDWLLIFACVSIFILLPLLFAWSSTSMIHNRIYEPRFLISKAASDYVLTSPQEPPQKS